MLNGAVLLSGCVVIKQEPGWEKGKSQEVLGAALWLCWGTDKGEAGKKSVCSDVRILKSIGK